MSSSQPLATLILVSLPLHPNKLSATPSNLPYSFFQLRETIKEGKLSIDLKNLGGIVRHHAMTILNRKYYYRRLTHNCRNNINYRVNFWGNYNINYWVNNRSAGRDNRASWQQERGYRTIRTSNTSRGHSRFRRIMKNTFETCRNISYSCQMTGWTAASGRRHSALNTQGDIIKLNLGQWDILVSFCLCEGNLFVSCWNHCIIDYHKLHVKPSSSCWIN